MPRRLVRDTCALKITPRYHLISMWMASTKTKNRTHILSLENREKLESVRTAAENIKPAIAGGGQRGKRPPQKKLNLEVWGDGLVGENGRV